MRDATVTYTQAKECNVQQQLTAHGHNWCCQLNEPGAQNASAFLQIECGLAESDGSYNTREQRAHDRRDENDIEILPNLVY